jgi:hypothetical protein
VPKAMLRPFSLLGDGFACNKREYNPNPKLTTERWIELEDYLIFYGWFIE